MLSTPSAIRSVRSAMSSTLTARRIVGNGEQRGKHGALLDAGQVGADAHMGAVAEGEVDVGSAVEVEYVRLQEGSGIVVGGVDRDERQVSSGRSGLPAISTSGCAERINPPALLVAESRRIASAVRSTCPVGSATNWSRRDRALSRNSVSSAMRVEVVSWPPNQSTYRRSAPGTGRRPPRHGRASG